MLHGAFWRLCEWPNCANEPKVPYFTSKFNTKSLEWTIFHFCFYSSTHIENTLMGDLRTFHFQCSIPLMNNFSSTICHQFLIQSAHSTLQLLPILTSHLQIPRWPFFHVLLYTSNIPTSMFPTNILPNFVDRWNRTFRRFCHRVQ